jgi:hypothetical protein
MHPPAESVSTELDWCMQPINSASTQSDEERPGPGQPGEDGNNAIRKMEDVEGWPARFRRFLNQREAISLDGSPSESRIRPSMRFQRTGSHSIAMCVLISRRSYQG